MDVSNLPKYMFYISLAKPMTAKAYRVLLYLLGTIGFTKEFQKITQLTIAMNLEISKSDMSKSLAELVEIGILEAEILSERRKLFRLKTFTRKQLTEMINDL